MMSLDHSVPMKSLRYHWQVEIHRVRLQAWATRELACLVRLETDRVRAHWQRVRRRRLRLLA
jgi:hypothetical protein